PSAGSRVPAPASTALTASTTPARSAQYRTTATGTTASVRSWAASPALLWCRYITAASSATRGSPGPGSPSSCATSSPSATVNSTDTIRPCGAAAGQSASTQANGTTPASTSCGGAASSNAATPVAHTSARTASPLTVARRHQA